MNFNIPGFSKQEANYSKPYDLEGVKDRFDTINDAEMGTDWAAKFSEVPGAMEIGHAVVPAAAETPDLAESAEEPEQSNVINVDFARRQVDDALGGGGGNELAA